MNTDKLYANYRKVEVDHLKGKTDQQLDAIWEKVSDAYRFGNLASSAKSAIENFLKENGYICKETQMTTQQITKELGKLGAAWHRTAKKQGEYYEILPDASYPHRETIEYFSNLQEIASWIQAMKKAQKAGSEEKAYQIMENYKISRM